MEDESDLIRNVPLFKSASHSVDWIIEVYMPRNRCRRTRSRTQAQHRHGRHPSLVDRIARLPEFAVVTDIRNVAPAVPTDRLPGTPPPSSRAACLRPYS
jgi:hypothetical protein